MSFRALNPDRTLHHLTAFRDENPEDFDDHVKKFLTPPRCSCGKLMAHSVTSDKPYFCEFCEPATTLPPDR